MPLSTNGLPLTTPSSLPNMISQSNDSNLSSLPISMHGVALQNHSMVMNNQNNSLMHISTRHLHLNNDNQLNQPHSILPTNMNPSRQMTATSSLHAISDNSNMGNMNLMVPYNNIQVKQERGIPVTIPTIRHNSAQSPVQYSQLSSTDMVSGNIFSVQSTAPAVSKHICSVCGDRASGKHYGVYSCEGCKGFFKRTVRKYLTYTCRDEKECVIDKRQRNRCQYCRYKKCLSMGMKKEAVQDERQKTRDQDETFAETSLADEMPVEKILEAELMSDPRQDETSPDFEAMEIERGVYLAADHQLYTLVDWAKRVPHFTSLSLDDQVTLLRAGWNELLISSFSHRSINHPDAIVFSIGFRVYRQTAKSAGVGAIFDRVLSELISKMRQMNMDRTELGCLRAIVLFNPDVKELTDANLIESLREKVYASLEIYCRSKYPEQAGRFAKLLLRLPALRSIALKCLEHLFVFKLIGNEPINEYLIDKLINEKKHTNNYKPKSTSVDASKVSSP